METDGGLLSGLLGAGGAVAVLVVGGLIALFWFLFRGNN